MRSRKPNKPKKKELAVARNWARLVRSTITLYKHRRTQSTQGLHGSGVVDVDDIMFKDNDKLFEASKEHVHYFPKDKEVYNAETGEWTRTCACGFSTTYEDM